MQKVNSETDLRQAILELEGKRALEGMMLKEQFFLAVESIRPVNLIKSTFREVALSREIKDNLTTTGVSLAAGYLVKTAIGFLTKSPAKRLLGTALIYGITKVAATHPATVKSLGQGLMKMIKRKKRERTHDDRERTHDDNV
jgi:hypothetical protein